MTGFKRYFLIPVLCTLFPVLASAATMGFGGPSSATVGSTFNVPVLVSTAAGESANAISGTVSYPANLLTLVNVSKVGSIITLWPSDPSQSSGSAHFEGVILNPGYSGTNGTLVVLTFQAKAPGPAALAFSDASVLANDGNATPILSGTQPDTIVVIAAPQTQTQVPPTSSAAKGTVVITSSTNPNQAKWYNISNVQLNWTLDPGATAVRIGYDKFPDGQPTVVYDPSVTHKTLNLKDGTWYFHAQERVNGGWSAVTTFKLNVDTTPPVPMDLRFPHGTVTNDPRPVALFDTTDETSGIAYYTVSVDGNGTVRLASADVSSNPYVVPVQNPGTSTLSVVAYDNAGNSTTATESFTVQGIDAPVLDPINPVAQGDILQISGLTAPNARVDVYIKDSSGAVTSQWSRTSSNGAFKIIWTTHLDVGTYSVTAQTTDDTGAKSFMSNPLTLTVTLPARSLLKEIAFNYIPFAVAMLVIFFVIGYFSGFPLIRRLIKPMAMPAHAKLHAEFSELHEAITKEMFAMRHAKTKRELTDEEEHFLERFEKLLTKAEKTIEKDILNGK